jgi:hypothetical protein
MSSDYIGWFSALKHILKGHASTWSKLWDFYLVFLKLSCVMWMLESLEFEVWTLELHCAACTCACGLTVCNLLLQMGKVFWDSSSTLLRVHEIVVCLLPNAFSTWLIQIVKLCYVHLVWLPKAHSWFSTIVSHTTQIFLIKIVNLFHSENFQITTLYTLPGWV